MQAVRFIGVGRPAQIDDVPKPSPGPGQVLIKVGGAGVCHSDLHVMEEDFGFQPPFTLGHENAGWVSEIGEGVTGLRKATPSPSTVHGAAAAATRASSRWRTWSKQRLDDCRIGRRPP